MALDDVLHRNAGARRYVLEIRTVLAAVHDRDLDGVRRDVNLR